MDVDTLVSLLYCFGGLAMFLAIILRKQRYQITFKECCIISLVLVIGGISGAKLMFYIENGYFGGQSYYGAVFLVPVVLFFTSIWMKKDFGSLLSLAAPTGCLMPAVLRIGCLETGCCGGNDFFNQHFPIPLQALEAITAILISVCLILIENDSKKRACLYGWYLIFQGCIRFVLNSFRKDLTAFILIPAGHFWSLIAFILGIFYVSNEEKVHLVLKSCQEKLILKFSKGVDYEKNQ